jgi:hypothetical protein
MVLVIGGPSYYWDNVDATIQMIIVRVLVEFKGLTVGRNIPFPGL